MIQDCIAHFGGGVINGQRRFLPNPPPPAWQVPVYEPMSYDIEKLLKMDPRDSFVKIETYRLCRVRGHDAYYITEKEWIR